MSNEYAKFRMNGHHLPADKLTDYIIDRARKKEHQAAMNGGSLNIGSVEREVRIWHAGLDGRIPDEWDSDAADLAQLMGESGKTESQDHGRSPVIGESELPPGWTVELSVPGCIEDGDPPLFNLRAADGTKELLGK